MSPVFIRRVLAKLTKAGLTDSRPGAEGRSIVAKPAHKITLLDAYTAITEDDATVLARHPG